MLPLKGSVAESRRENYDKYFLTKAVSLLSVISTFGNKRAIRIYSSEKNQR